jgi:flagellar biosynthesis protein FlhA
MEKFLERIKFLTKNSDLAIALGFVFILSVMIIPIAPFMMDIFIALGLGSALVILLLSVYAKRPLDFSVFPSVLLMVTLFRLSLNVASTRNILIRGGTDGLEAAGSIIYSFGNYLVGGNYAVGIILFIILVIINFIVITKGAGRVAEVAARFTLDAMPGKQMAIDADLNAGLISDEEAKTRRSEVAKEADFYGSMDGASKFVRGDAIAGILITGVNILGGIIIGVAQNGMDIAQATEIFTLLTIGDGLVAQIPALIISTAAGIITTRSSDDDSLGTQIGKQFSVNPKALYIAGGMLSLFALIPNFPIITFIGLGGALAGCGYLIEQNKKGEELASKKQKIIEGKKGGDDLENLLDIEMVELEVGYGLVSLVDTDQNGDLLERITQIRKQFARDWGVIIPSVRIKDNLELKAGGYKINIKGITVSDGELVPGQYLAMDPGTVIEKVQGMETIEPVFGLPAVWINEDAKDEAQYNGYTVVDLSTVIATHLTEVLKSSLEEIFGRQELAAILDRVKQSNPKIVEDLIPEILDLGKVLKVVKNLLKESISIKDMRTILECLADSAASTKDPEDLTEAVRSGLRRTITENIKSEQGDIPLFTLDRALEEKLLGCLSENEKLKGLNLDAQTTQNILSSLNDKIEQATSLGEKMIVLCSPVIRRHFKLLTEKFIPNLVVVSHNEINPEVQIRSLGTVGV